MGFQFNPFTGNFDIDNNTDFTDLTKEPTGFTENANITVTYSHANRTITLNGTFQAYYKGQLITALTDGWVSDPHDANPTGTLFLKYNGSGFTWSYTPWNFSEVQIAYVCVDYQGNVRFGQREPHDLLQHQMHELWHSYIGTQKVSGADLSGYTVSSPVTTNRRPDVSQTVVADEDLKSTLPALINSSVGAGRNLAIYTQISLTGTGANTACTLDQIDIIRLSGNQPYYNVNSGGNWTQALMPALNYMSVWLIAIPTTADATSQKYRFLWMQGQTYGTLSSQQALSPADLNIGDLRSLSPEFIFVAKVIIYYQSNAGGQWWIQQVQNITGTKFSQTSAGGSFLTTVATDATLTGTGQAASPLSVSGMIERSNPTLELRSTSSNAVNSGTLKLSTASGSESFTLTFDASANMFKMLYVAGEQVRITNLGMGINGTSPANDAAFTTTSALCTTNTGAGWGVVNASDNVRADFRAESGSYSAGIYGQGGLIFQSGYSSAQGVADMTLSIGTTVSGAAGNLFINCALNQDYTQLGFINISSSPSVNTDGAPINLTSGYSQVSTGGHINLETGYGYNGSGGSFQLMCGYSEFVDGGGVLFNCGNALNYGNGGGLQVYTGYSVYANAGNVTFSLGQANNYGTGGSFSVGCGASGYGTGGYVSLSAGSGETGGDVALSAGYGNSLAGVININAGSSATGSGGYIYLNVGGGTSPGLVYATGEIVAAQGINIPDYTVVTAPTVGCVGWDSLNNWLVRWDGASWTQIL